ncbi:MULTISPECIES: hypothetical protein [unclassified Moorena]|uniref:hypothetical protein n=1 Tax=unclassified Moorena TaxID=2683338 RepID=UPI0025E4969A|nr:MULTISPECIES: hypothetical protein [unclassified Moorena]
MIQQRLLTWQLWLARECVGDRPLRRQKPLAVSSLSPERVAQSFGSILTIIGTPSQPPKLRGKSPGWPLDTPRTPRKRYPTVKKGRGRFHSQSKYRKSSA